MDAMAEMMIEIFNRASIKDPTWQEFIIKKGESMKIPPRNAKGTVKDSLQSGSSQEVISKNIETEKKAHPEMSNEQAAAIAYSKARESK